MWLQYLRYLSSCCRRYSSQYSEMDGVQEGESVDWLNEMMRKIWLHLETITQKLATEKIQPMAQDIFTKYHLKGFRLKSLSLGSSPPRLDNVKVLNSQIDKIVMEADVIYDGDASVGVSFMNISGGVTGITLHGRVRVELFLVDWMPLVGGALISFTTTPSLDFDLTGWANIGDMPGLKNRVREPIMDQIKSRLLYPNKIPVLTDKKTKMDRLLLPQETGILVVKVVEALNLSKKKQLFKISPYCELTLGAISKKTVIKEGTDPVWEEIVEFPLDYAGGIKLKVTVMDKDHFTHNDFLGHAVLDIDEEARDVWVYLEGIEQGKLHLQTHLLRTSVTHLPLTVQGDAVCFSKVDPSKMLLMVYVDSVVITECRAQKIKVKVAVNGEVKEVSENKIKNKKGKDAVGDTGKGQLVERGIGEDIVEGEKLEGGEETIEKNRKEETEEGEETDKSAKGIKAEAGRLMMVGKTKMKRAMSERRATMEKGDLEVKDQYHSMDNNTTKDDGEVANMIKEVEYTAADEVKENKGEGNAEHLINGEEIMEDKRINTSKLKGLAEEFSDMAKKSFNEGLGKMGVDNKGLVIDNDVDEVDGNNSMKLKGNIDNMDQENEMTSLQDTLIGDREEDMNTMTNEKTFQDKNMELGRVKVEEAFTFIGGEMKELKVFIMDGKNKERLGFVKVDIDTVRNKENLEEPLQFIPLKSYKDVKQHEGDGVNLSLRLRYLVQTGI